MYQVEEILNIIFLVYLFMRPLNLLFKNYNQHIHINRLYYCLVDEEKHKWRLLAFAKKYVFRQLEFQE